MTEPKVGMKFSSYLEMGKQYEKLSDSAKIDSYERQQGNNPYNKVKVFNTEYKNKSGYSFAHSSLETYNKTQTSTFSTESFTYQGSGSIYDKDIKYSRINGTKSHAIDLNHNGVVDKGEIFSNK